MEKIASFTIDHNRLLRGIYVSRKDNVGGDVVTTFDIRMKEPNREPTLHPGALHTIEHLLASLLRDRLDGVIDCSPFGCRTGFHLIVWGEHSTTEVAKALKSSLEEIRDTITWEDVPGTTIKTCGNYRDHSLFTAKEWCRDILEEGISDDPFERHVI